MGLVAIKKLDDLKKLKVGERLPVEDFVDPEFGYLELKGFGFIHKDVGISSYKGTTYIANPIIKGIQIDEKEGYAEIQVELQISEDHPQHGAIGTLQCIIE